MEDIRVRFAPSPTGTLHIGGARTALFNWLYARSLGGKLILRLEDTDTTRSTEDSARGIIEGLEWLGIDWDEGPLKGGAFGPYRQSERLPLYKQYIQQLLDEGKAYYCFCSPEELKIQREKAERNKLNYKYEGTCKSLTSSQVKELLEQGMQPVVRLKVPNTGVTVVHDLIRGDVEFDNRLLDDFIIAKSDGWPTYNFAVVIDDHFMKISHVIRAEEHLSNTPKQLLIYNALKIDAPQFAHVSMILAPDRSKLSKRHGATSVQEFRDQGYLPQALINYLALLGWSPGNDVDIMSVQDMIAGFDLNNVSKSAAIYDTSKLTWMNGHYIAEANIDWIFELIDKPARAKGWFTDDNREYCKQVIDLVRSRAKTLYEIFDLAEYFFNPVINYDEKGANKYFSRPGAIDKLTAVLNMISSANVLYASELEQKLRSQAESMGLKASELIHPTRLAISGRTMTPGLFEVMELLGAETCMQRIKQAISFIA
ncbi:MAG: glutamate--tRNA ligase [Syntrophomonas sp.]